MLFRALLFVLIFVSSSLVNTNLAFSQKKSSPLCTLTQVEYEQFPDSFDVVQKVFVHYYHIADKKKGIKKLNPQQQVLYYHFVADGKIGNEGMYGFLLETRGEYFKGYAAALERIGDTISQQLILEAEKVYLKYKKWFYQLEAPPAFSEEDPAYDIMEDYKLREIEKKWGAHYYKREEMFSNYLRANKTLLAQSLASTSVR
jgi:hypothetical protein